MLALVYMILFNLCHCSLSIDFTYRIKEGNMQLSYIGDIAVDTGAVDGIKTEEHHLVSFHQLQKDKENISQLFNITNEGKFYVVKTLDAEKLCKYKKKCSRIVDVAMQKGEIFLRILEIKVIVEDVNDHQPVFPINQITLRFSEGDKKGTTMSIPNALDGDITERNSRISYKLLTNNELPFKMVVTERVDGSYSVGITLEKELDREMKDHYYFQIIAMDGGSPPKQGMLKVYIKVLDINDNLPIFDQGVYNISIDNKHRIRKALTRLTAKDLDTGENGKVTYHFSSKTSELTKSSFQLDKNSGEVFLSKRFPFKKRQTYELYVEAMDGGKPPLSSITLVYVTIMNQQNNPPVIDMNFVSKFSNNMATISENTKIGSFIAYVKISDSDSGQNGEVTCLLQHDKFELKYLGEKKYKVVLKSQADKEKESHISFRVVCEDHGFPRLKTEKDFSVLVTDINDETPKFNKETYKFMTYENEGSGFPIGFVNATDPDIGLGGLLIFTLFSKKNNGAATSSLPFQITNYGFISTTESLDREEKDIYIFQVLVKDSGNPSLNNTVDVIVEVMDRNDNAPFFTFPSVNPFSLDFHFQGENNNDITQLKAYDKDSKENAFLTYQILEGNNKGLFILNSYTGVLSFSRNVYRTEAGQYNLLFGVKDNGIPILSTTTSLSLTLVASNNTFPLRTLASKDIDFQIQINLFLLIIAAAVTVSVIMVIIITICVLKYSKQRMPSRKQRIIPSDRIFYVDKETQNSCEQTCYDPPFLRADTHHNHNHHHNQQQQQQQQNNFTKFQENRKQSLPNPKVTLKGVNYSSRVPYQASSKEIHQIYVKNTRAPSNSKGNDKTNVQNYFANYRRMTGKSSEFGGREGTHYEELPGFQQLQKRGSMKTSSSKPQAGGTARGDAGLGVGSGAIVLYGGGGGGGGGGVSGGGGGVGGNSMQQQPAENHCNIRYNESVAATTHNISTTLSLILPPKCLSPTFPKPLPAIPHTSFNI
ncbi:protocadherin beta-15-like [Argonauta hians]